MIAKRAAEVGQQPLPLLFRLVGHPLPLEDLDRTQRDRTADRMAAVGIGVHPHGLSRVQDLTNLISDADAAQRKVAGSNPFGELNYVWMNAPMIQGKH